jgi:hypothetical protein
MAAFIRFNSYNARTKSQENIGLSTLICTDIKDEVIGPQPHQGSMIEVLLSLARS